MNFDFEIPFIEIQSKIKNRWIKNGGRSSKLFLNATMLPNQNVLLNLFQYLPGYKHNI